MFLLFLSPVKFFCGVRKQDFWVGFSSGNIGCFNAFAALNGEQYIYIYIYGGFPILEIPEMVAPFNHPFEYDFPL